MKELEAAVRDGKLAHEKELQALKAATDGSKDNLTAKLAAAESAFASARAQVTDLEVCRLLWPHCAF